jgi:hypothetical protein
MRIFSAVFEKALYYAVLKRRTKGSFQSFKSSALKLVKAYIEPIPYLEKRKKMCLIG